MTVAAGGRGEVGAAARGSVVTLLGAAASAGFGFLVVVLLAQLLGVRDSGVVLQAVAVFMIALAVSRLGVDTVAMWLVPRLQVQRPAAIPAALTTILVPAFVAPCLVVGAWFLLLLVAPGPVFGSDVDAAMSAVAPFLPFGSLTIVAVTASRALGSVLPFNLINNIAVPGARLAVIPLAVAAGGAAVASAGAWAAVYLPAALVSVAVLHRGVRRAYPDQPFLARPDRPMIRQVAGFGLPRTVSAVAEQANMWLPLVLVGVLLDASSAGAYGAAGRFVAAGVVVSTAARIAVAPRFSALLARGDTATVAHLYAVTARWVLLFGSPIYVVLAVNSQTILRWLGDGFEDATTSMVILCLGATLSLAAGNVQSLLLMSGGSGRAAANTSVAQIVMITGIFALVPPFGMTGAAVAWVLGTALDVTLAIVQVQRRTGILLDLLPTVAVVVLVIVCAGGPCLAAVHLLGPTWAALGVGIVGTAVCLLAGSWFFREALHLGEIASAFRRG